jgi:hypothetical protein
MKPNSKSEGLYFRRLLVWLMIPIMFGCSYYKPVRQSIPSDSAKMALLQREEARTLILHSGNNNYVLEKKVVNPNMNNLSGVLGKVPPEHRDYIDDKKMKYQLASKTDPVLQEMHVYTKLDTAKTAGSNVTIGARDIFRMDLIQEDKKRSRESWSTVTFVAIGVAVLVGIFYLIGSNMDFGFTFQ